MTCLFGIKIFGGDDELSQGGFSLSVLTNLLYIAKK